jgi:hypothetical protein
VIASNDPATIIPEKKSSMFYGLKGFDLAKYKKSEIFAMMFLNWHLRIERQKLHL